MAAMMRRLGGSEASFAWRAGAPAGRRSTRQRWLRAGLMIAGTLALAVSSSAISLRVSAERSALARAEQANRALDRQLKALDAELRVRMRLPQLERWNAEVLGLKPIAAEQFVESPLLLAAYGAPAAAIPRPLPALAEAPPRAVAPIPVAAPGGAPAAAAPQLALRTAGRTPAPALDPLLVAAVEELARQERAADPAALVQVALSGDPPRP